MGICLRYSLDYSGIMPKMFVLLSLRVVSLYFLFRRCSSSEKLERKSVPQVSYHTVSVLFVLSLLIYNMKFVYQRKDVCSSLYQCKVLTFFVQLLRFVSFIDLHLIKVRIVL